jgi:hypothetical protein
MKFESTRLKSGTYIMINNTASKRIRNGSTARYICGSGFLNWELARKIFNARGGII